MPHPETLPSDSLSINSKPVNTPDQFRLLRNAAPLLLLCLVFGILYHDGLIWLLEVWSHNDYSHGYLIPLVSLYLVWEQRDRFRLLPVAPAYPAAALIILAALSLLLVSRYSAFIQLEGASIFLIIPGILLLLFGRQITRAALLPWLYLSFMLPWFDLFLPQIQPPFQRISAILGAKLLSLYYPVFLNDVYIQLPSINMEVARECSGVNFFISVLAIGIPLVYLTQRSWFRAATVIGLGMIITVLANGFRIAMAGVMGQNFGPALLHGPAHILQGWFVAWIGWAGLFLVNWLVINRYDTITPRLYERWQLHLISNTKENQKVHTPLKQIYTGVIILTLCTAGIYFASPRPVPLPTPLANLPIKIAGWTGTDVNWLDKKTIFPGDEWRNQEVLFPRADEELSRVYRSNQSAEPIYIYIAYFNKQTERKRLISGFSRPLHKNARFIVLQDLVPGIIPPKVNRTTLTQDGISYTIFFWYQFPDVEMVTGRNEARLMAFKDGIINRHNNGMVVLIATPQTVDDIPSSITTFLKASGSTITGLLP